LQTDLLLDKNSPVKSDGLCDNFAKFVCAPGVRQDGTGKGFVSNPRIQWPTFSKTLNLK